MSYSRKDSKRDLRMRENHFFATSESFSLFSGPVLLNEVIYGVPAWAPKSGWSLQREVLTHSTSGQSLFLQLDQRQPTDYTQHISSFLT